RHTPLDRIEITRAFDDSLSDRFCGGGGFSVLRDAPRQRYKRDWCRAKRREIEAGSTGVRSEHRRVTRFGKFSSLAAELVIAVSARARELWHLDGLDDLVVAERRGERAQHEVLDRERARSNDAPDVDGCAKRGERQRPTGRRIGMSNAAADGAAVADR